MNATYIVELVTIIGFAISTLLFNILKSKKEKSHQLVK